MHYYIGNNVGCNWFSEKECWSGCRNMMSQGHGVENKKVQKKKGEMPDYKWNCSYIITYLLVPSILSSCSVLGNGTDRPETLVTSGQPTPWNIPQVGRPLIKCFLYRESLPKFSATCLVSMGAIQNQLSTLGRLWGWVSWWRGQTIPFISHPESQLIGQYFTSCHYWQVQPLLHFNFGTDHHCFKHMSKYCRADIVISHYAPMMLLALWCIALYFK
jgi:hypothetical protein